MRRRILNIKNKNNLSSIETIIPVTSAMESDFVILKYVKNNYKNKVSKINLKGMIHSKQYNLLSSLL